MNMFDAFPHQPGSSQRGFTLLEFMVVMALIAIGLALTVVNFSEADTKRNSTQAIIDLQAVIAAARSQKDLITGYTGIDEVQVATSTAFPQQLCSLGNCANGISSSAFGDVYVINDSLSTFINKGFMLRTYGISAADCVAIASRMIYSVDAISVRSSLTSVSRSYVSRSSVLASASSKSARDWFYYHATAATTGICRYTWNYMDFDVDTL